MSTIFIWKGHNNTIILHMYFPILFFGGYLYYLKTMSVLEMSQNKTLLHISFLQLYSYYLPPNSSIVINRLFSQKLCTFHSPCGFPVALPNTYSNFLPICTPASDAPSTVKFSKLHAKVKSSNSRYVFFI